MLNKYNTSFLVTHLGKDDLIVRVADLDVHADPLRRRGKAVCSRVVELYLVVA